MKSLLYGDAESRVFPPALRNRTRNEGMLNQKRGSEGTMKHLLSDPALVPPKPKTSKTREEKNFAHENIRQIRRISIQRQLSQQNGNKSLAATWSISRPNIPQSGTTIPQPNRPLSTLLRPQSVTPSQLVQPPSRSAPNPSVVRSRSQINLRASGTTTGQRNITQPRNNVTPPSRPASGALLNQTMKNFVQSNTRNILPRSRSFSTDARGRGRVPSPSRPNSVKPEIQKSKPGELPQYLLERREEWKSIEEAAKMAAQKPKLPPGCYIMPEDEKMALINQLQQSKQKKEREIFLLPVRSDTLRAQRKRQELEAALVEIEEGLEILSKPTVIVQDPNDQPPPIPEPPKIIPRPTSVKVTNGVTPKSKPVWNQGAVDRNKGLVNPKLATKKSVSESVQKPVVSAPLVNSHTKIFKRTA